MGVYLYPNNTETELKNAYIGEYVEETVQTFDFQNDGSLNWTAQTVYGTPTFTNGQGWTIGTSSDSNYQANILPPSSIYGGELKKVKIRLYKGVATTMNSTVGAGPSSNNFSNGLGIWCFGAGGRQNAFVNIYDCNSDHLTQTVDEVGEVIQEWIFNDDGSLLFVLNGTNEYNLGNYANLFKTNWGNDDFAISIGRWGEPNGSIYVRKVEITTV